MSYYETAEQRQIREQRNRIERLTAELNGTLPCFFPHSKRWPVGVLIESKKQPIRKGGWVDQAL